MIDLLNISTTHLYIKRRAGQSAAFLQSPIGKDLVLNMLSDIRLLSAQVDTVLATSFH